MAINLIERIGSGFQTKISDIVQLLQADGQLLSQLYKAADESRQKNHGEDVFIRGIIEFSNYCFRDCYYCGIGRSNQEIQRYRIPDAEIIAACREFMKNNITTVVLQSGEDNYYTPERMAELLVRLKKETGLAITLSVGERNKDTYALWAKSGMDRYLLRFETSDRDLFKLCHPDDDYDRRMQCLTDLKKLRVQTGSGFLIGLPRETLEQLARDILFCTELQLEMIGCGPFIAHDKTEFAGRANPFDKEIYFKTMAILRLLNPLAHIPATTAFDAVQSNGRNLLLQRGCNVFMPNMTPLKYRKLYQLYPGKPCLDEEAADCAGCVQKRILNIGRQVGTGPGHSIRQV